MQIHFIVHEVFEAPGAYLRWAQARGYGSPGNITVPWMLKNKQMSEMKNGNIRV